MLFQRKKHQGCLELYKVEAQCRQNVKFQKYHLRLDQQDKLIDLEVSEMKLSTWLGQNLK
jgi:hypothetical protein